MEQQGILRSWNDDKGFGFIRANNTDYFVHISDVYGERGPQQGENVYFVAGKDPQGRLRAQHMRSTELSIDQPTIRRKPKTTAQANTTLQRPRRRSQANLKRSLSLILLSCAIPAVGVWQDFNVHAVIWPLLVYLGMSIVSVVQYWRDKYSAQHGLWRIPEAQLHAVELLGGWPGALLAQQLLRHKTKKTSYQVVFWLIMLMHQIYWLEQLGFSVQFRQQALSTL